MRSIEERAKFDFIRYANCWEDPELLLKALHPLENETVLSIASAGDNSFSLLSANPKKVVAVDFNPAQLACCDLRRAAFLNLSYEQLLSFLGINENEERLETYDKLKKDLLPETIQYWDAFLIGVSDGIVHQGKFENYLKLFGTRLLPFIHGKKKVTALLEPKTIEEQEKFYTQHWDSFLWRSLFKVFFSKKVMGKMGRDAEFFNYSETSPGEMILNRTKHALTRIPTHSNPYLTYILTGSFKQSLPHYLRKENVELIKKNLPNLELLHCGVSEAMEKYPNAFTRFNLSDIFEYMSKEEFQKISDQLFSNSGATAKVAYWNLVALRNMNSFSEQWETDFELSEQLHAEDKAWFYSKFFISEKKHA